MTDEDRKWIEEVTSACSALALWVCGELDPKSPEVLKRDLQTLFDFVTEVVCRADAWLTVRKH